MDPVADEKRTRTTCRRARPRPADALGRREPLVEGLGRHREPPGNDALVRLAAERPVFARPPIVERGDRAVPARSPDGVPVLP